MGTNNQILWSINLASTCSLRISLGVLWGSMMLIRNTRPPPTTAATTEAQNKAELREEASNLITQVAQQLGIPANQSESRLVQCDMQVATSLLSRNLGLLYNMIAEIAVPLSKNSELSPANELIQLRIATKDALIQLNVVSQYNALINTLFSPERQIIENKTLENVKNGLEAINNWANRFDPTALLMGRNWETARKFTLESLTFLLANHAVRFRQ